MDEEKRKQEEPQADEEGLKRPEEEIADLEPEEDDTDRVKGGIKWGDAAPEE